jgi:alkylhydroperoxidase family enzyme
MAAHSTLARKAGASGELVTALRAGQPPSDARSRALFIFVGHVVRGRGRVSPREVDLLVDAGFTPAQALEALVGVAMTTLANQMFHLALTPLDAPFQAQAWARP